MTDLWEVAQIVLLVLLTGFGVWSVISRQILTHRIDQMQEDLVSLERDLSAVCTSASRAGDRLVDAENRNRLIAKRQTEFEASMPNTVRYKQAESMLRRGAADEELINSCGLSRGEAELLRCLQDGISSAV